MALTSGSRVGPYEVLSLLGSGGMGKVWKARDPRLNRDVAIKVLPAALSADPDRLRRFQLEAQAVAALNHPHICQIYDVGPDYLVLEYVAGACSPYLDSLRSGPRWKALLKTMNLPEEQGWS